MTAMLPILIVSAVVAVAGVFFAERAHNQKHPHAGK